MLYKRQSLKGRLKLALDVVRYVSEPCWEIRIVLEDGVIGCIPVRNNGKVGSVRWSDDRGRKWRRKCSSAYAANWQDHVFRFAVMDTKIISPYMIYDGSLWRFMSPEVLRSFCKLISQGASDLWPLIENEVRDCFDVTEIVQELDESNLLDGVRKVRTLMFADGKRLRVTSSQLTADRYHKYLVCERLTEDGSVIERGLFSVPAVATPSAAA